MFNQLKTSPNKLKVLWLTILVENESLWEFEIYVYRKKVVWFQHVGVMDISKHALFSEQYKNIYSGPSGYYYHKIYHVVECNFLACI